MTPPISGITSFLIELLHQELNQARKNPTTIFFCENHMLGASWNRFLGGSTNCEPTECFRYFDADGVADRQSVLWCLWLALFLAGGIVFLCFLVLNAARCCLIKGKRGKQFSCMKIHEFPNMSTSRSVGLQGIIPKRAGSKIERALFQKCGKDPKEYRRRARSSLVRPGFYRWWQLKPFLNFRPYLQRWSNLTNIFQMGRNHQLYSDFCWSPERGGWGAFGAGRTT